MQSKSPRICTMLLFTLGLVISINVNAAATEPTFVGLVECQNSYSLQVNPVAVEQRSTPAYLSSMQTYCQAHMPIVNYKIDLCIEDKLKAYAAKLQPPVAVSEAIRSQKTPEYRPVCTTLASTPATTASPYAQYANLPGCEVIAAGSPGTQAEQVACQQAIARDKVRIDGLAKAEAERKAAEAAAKQQRAAAGAGAGLGVIGAIAPALGNMFGGNDNRNSNNGGSGSTAGGNGAPGSNQEYALPRLDLSGHAQPTVGAAPAPTPTAETAGPLAQAASTEMANTRGQLPRDLQWPADQATSSTNADRDGQTRVQRTSISQTAQQNARALASDANSLLQQLRERLCVAADPTDQLSSGFTKYKKTLLAFEQSIGNKDATLATTCPESAQTPSCRNNENFGTSPEIAPDNVSITNGAVSHESVHATNDPAAQGGQQAQCSNALATYNSGRAGACASDAERAEKLCVESDSMKLLKGVMDAAGPALLALNATARTCGGMNNVSKFVGAGLTVANAVCLVKKNKCEKSCSDLASTFQTEMGNLEQKFRAGADGGEVKADFDRTQKFCVKHLTMAEEARTAARAATQAQNTALAETKTTEAHEEDAKAENCNRQNQASMNAANQAVQRISQFKQREADPQKAGTAIAMDKKCKEKMRNIVGLASNIGALALAASNAKKCEQALNTGGSTEGGTSAVPTVAAAEYCANDATKETQFCKCQSSPSTQGCAAVLAAGPAPGTTPQEQRGINLKSGAGPSAFAGGGSGGTNGAGGYRAYGGAGADGTATTQASLGTVGSSLNGGAAPAGGAGGGGVGSTTASGARGSEALDAKKEKDDKKWSFGTFASAVGSSLGFGGGSGSGSGSGASSGSESNQERIERKLASDKYAAEVSSSTGADNFDKVKRSYVQRADSFMGP